jgi:SNF2 family DNA or RNA helicase
MTGTPVENRLEELWSIFQFLNPGYLGGYSDFQRRFVVPMNAGDPDAAARLRRRIAPYLLRRTKKEVEPELPPRTDIVLECELGETERTIYDALRAASSAAAIRSLQSGGSVINALELLLRLRQAACHSDLIPGCSAEGSSKIDLLIEMLGTTIANGHKALVFSQWTRFLDLIEPHLRRAGIPFGRLDGRTVDRAFVVRNFQEQPGQPVLLISLKAGGTGLNLTAADHVFILDPWWNPATEDQAADRTHRIGQDRHVMVYRLIASATVEEKILALQEKKRKIAAAALQVGAKALSLTRDDLLELLG